MADEGARAEKGGRPGTAPYAALAVFALIAWAAAAIWALHAGCEEDAAVGGPAVEGAGAARIDLNRASAEELQALPGIGPVLSRRIAEERGRLGGFRSAEDLLRVRGVTKELVRRLRPFVKAGEAGDTGSER
jgi:competence ComEA-like helix-hairpin-helix protein